MKILTYLLFVLSLNSLAQTRVATEIATNKKFCTYKCSHTVQAGNGYAGQSPIQPEVGLQATYEECLGKAELKSKEIMKNICTIKNGYMGPVNCGFNWGGQAIGLPVFQVICGPF